MSRNHKEEKEDEKLTTWETLKNIGFIMKYLYHVNKALFFIRIPFLMLDTAAAFVSMLFLRNILNELTNGGNRQMNTVIWYAAGFALINLAISLVRRVFSIYDKMYLEKTSYGINLMLGRAISKLPFSDIEEPRMKDFISLAASTNSFSNVIDCTTRIASALINVITYAAIVVYVKPLILVLIVVVLIVQTLIYKLKRDDEYRWRMKQAPIFRRRNYYTNLLSNMHYGKEMRVNKLQDYFINKSETHFNEECIPVLKKAVFSEKGLHFIVEIAKIFQNFFIYLILSIEVIFYGMLVGDFSLYLSSTNKLTDGLSGLVAGFSDLMTCGNFAREFHYCIILSQKKRESFGHEIIPPNAKLSIEFRNVSFKYPHTENYVLKNISFKINAGESLSLIGVNGSGKSTLVKLLCRFYEPTEGKIFIGGIDSQMLCYEEYTRLMGVVFQDFNLFPFSVRENISMSENIDEQKIHFCIENSGLSEKIKSMEKGIDTIISKEFDEDGIEFSGGEGQKMSIARAIYKDSPIIILDEPTAALDPIAEYEIYQHFNSLTKGKTTIYISHRLSSARFTNKVAVISDGNLCEFGSHEELISIENGLYHEMFKMQAQHYN